MAVSCCRTNNSLGVFFTRLCAEQINLPWVKRNVNLIVPVYNHLKRTNLMVNGQCGLSHEKSKGFHTSAPLQILKNSAMFHKMEAETNISAFNNVENVHEMLNHLAVKLDDKMVSPSVVANVVNQLMTTFYEDLARNHKWIQTTNHIAYIQLILENKSESFTSPIREHANFGLLYTVVEDNFKEFNNAELASSLLSLVYLGMSPIDSLVTQMYLECRSRIPTFDMISLANASYITFGGRRDFVRTREMINRWNELMLDTSLEWTPEVVQGHCTLGSKFSRIVSLGTLQSACEKVLTSLNSNEELLKNPAVIGYVLRFAQYAFSDHRRKEFLPREMVTKAADLCQGIVSEYEAHQIAETCSALKALGCYSETTAHLFEHKAFELLTDECALRDVSNLLHALSKHTTKYVKSKFMQKLYTSLMVTEPDLILLSNISENFTFMKQLSLPKNVQEILQNSITERASNIINSDTRYRKITRFLIQSRLLDTEQKAVFRTKLYKQLEIMMHGITMRRSAKYCAFLLTMLEEPLSEDVFNYLMKEIGRWTDAHPFYLLLEGIVSRASPQHGQLQVQIDEIQAALLQSLQEKMTDTLSLDNLFLFTRYLFLSKRNRDPLLTDNIVLLFLKFTKKLIENYDEIAVERIASMFTDFRYQCPELVEDLVKIVIKHHDSMAPDTVISVLKTCAHLACAPQQSSEFTEAVLTVYSKCKAGNNILQMLCILYHLSLLQIFPENELSALFSMPSMEKIDEYLTNNPEYQHDIENYMLSLNRAVVLECPQLGVPWFHDINSIKVPKPDRFHREVSDCLVEVLGGGEFIQSPSLSHYGNPIAFEIQVDSDDQVLLPSTSTQDICKAEKTKRIAVQVLGRRHYCFNSKDQVGLTQTNTRQLEMMGYQVVEIPNLEWYALRYPHSKLDYIQEKIQRKF